MKCEICGTETRDLCTNQRCMGCHHLACTPGGSTSPGHGRGTKEAQERARRAARARKR